MGAETFEGKCSWFGGPHDMGVKADEGLALYPDHASMELAPSSLLFLDYQPNGTTGTARRLNYTKALYCAMRWDYEKTPIVYLRKTPILVSNPRNNYSVWVFPVDWGPNVKTGRIIDLSMFALDRLDATTNDTLKVSVPLP